MTTPTKRKTDLAAPVVTRALEKVLLRIPVPALLYEANAKRLAPRGIHARKRFGRLERSD